MKRFDPFRFSVRLILHQFTFGSYPDTPLFLVFQQSVDEKVLVFVGILDVDLFEVILFFVEAAQPVVGAYIERTV